MHENILESDDAWQLNRVYEGEGARGGYDESPIHVSRRRVLARKRLVEMGELVRQDWEDSRWVGDKYIDFTNKYMRKSQYETFLKAKESKWLHTAGERLDLKIKEIKRFGFDTQFGYAHVVTYNCENGNEYIYRGGSAPQISEDGFTAVKATIKHGSYRDIKQTMLQRIKVI